MEYEFQLGGLFPLSGARHTTIQDMTVDNLLG